MAGGGNVTERIDEAANMAVMGLDPFRYLYCTDSLERSMLVELHNRIIKLDEIRTNNLAVEIASQVGRLFKK